MSCPSCGASTEPGSKYCEECGAALPHVAEPTQQPPLKEAVLGGDGRASAHTRRTVVAADGKARVMTGDGNTTYDANVKGDGNVVVQGQGNRVNFGTGPVTLWIGIAVVAVVAIVYFLVSS